MLSWSAITNWDFNFEASMLVPLSRQVCFLFGAMAVLESIFLKYYSEFILKYVPSINDKFMVCFLSTLNLIFGFLMGFTLLLAGSPNEGPRLQGYFSELRPKASFSPG